MNVYNLRVRETKTGGSPRTDRLDKLRDLVSKYKASES